MFCVLVRGASSVSAIKENLSLRLECRLKVILVSLNVLEKLVDGL
jgi:hypothetical protein